MTDVISVDNLLSMNLLIPPYQRPYKWKIQSVQELLGDISDAIADSERYRNDFRYRIGTIILHRNSKGEYEIVDGQQRIITLTLIKLCIDSSYHNNIVDSVFDNSTTRINIHDNYTFIKEWFSVNESKKSLIDRAFSEILEVVFISVDKISEAFQLFDSQNSRGKELDPHDLLKAYHLREMKKYPYEMERAVTKWEEKSTDAIRALFDSYLYPINNWARGIKNRTFTVKDIDSYKGIDEGSPYSYARRASRGAPYFQITDPFIAGNDFFEMVDHYLLLIRNIEAELATNDTFSTIESVVNDRGYNKSAGFRYTVKMFKCSLLMYYDKFHNFDEMAVKKLFSWAFMLRVDVDKLGYESINRYAVGSVGESRYSNNISMFSLIDYARTHNEISALQIKTTRTPDRAANSNWNGLYMTLKAMNGMCEVTHE